jgi:hypothetical protein
MRLPVPKALRNRLKPTPQWLAITLPSPQTPVRVTALTRVAEIDVTDNNAIAALHPLTIRLGLDAPLGATVQREREIWLRFVDRTIDRTLGGLRLTYLREWRTAGARLGLFEVTGGRHRCAGWPRRAWDTWMYERAARHIPPERQMMPPAAVEQLMIFNLCPRPVFFVAVDDGRNSNLFPMDLVGPMAPEHFTLALRNTSPSVATIKNARRLVIADVPGDAAQIALAAILFARANHRCARTRDRAPRFPDRGLAYAVRRAHLHGAGARERRTPVSYQRDSSTFQSQRRSSVR